MGTDLSFKEAKRQLLLHKTRRQLQEGNTLKKEIASHHFINYKSLTKVEHCVNRDAGLEE